MPEATLDPDKEGREAVRYAGVPPTGRITTPLGEIPVVATKMSGRDRIGTILTRSGIGRMSYAVAPGLYAVGAPDAHSPVFVSANYKMSFDHLRRALDGRSAWIMVVDSRGINVWCAAGKGTFGTEEVASRIASTGLARIVSHRTVILPQLSASGVAAHTLVKRSGFRAVFGPVRAEDIPAFLDAGMKAEPAMRRVRFAFRDRLILAPVELAMVLRHPAFLIAAGIWIAGLLGVRFLAFDGLAVMGAIVVGTVLFPIALPWIPGRMFAWKGWLLGAAWTAAVILHRGLPGQSAKSWAAAAAYAFLIPALTAFLAMNFTGSSTFTCLSGVVKEMRTWLPLIIGSAILGVGALAAAML